MDFRSNPEIHEFPQAMTSKTQNIRTTVFALPRLDLDTLISMSPYRQYNLAIERQIWISSRTRLSTKAGSVTRSESRDEKTTLEFEGGSARTKRCVGGEFRSPERPPYKWIETFEGKGDEEETPTRKSERGEERIVGNDVIFVPNARTYFRKKGIIRKDNKISEGLRKKLSFENSLEGAEEEHCRLGKELQRNGFTDEMEKARINCGKSTKHAEDETVKRNGCKNGFIKLDRHSKSETNFGEGFGESRTNCFMKNEKVYLEERSVGSGIKSLEISNKCRFEIGGEDFEDTVESIERDMKENRKEIRRKEDEKLNEKRHAKLSENESEGEELKKNRFSINEEVQDLELQKNRGNDEIQQNLEEERVFENGKAEAEEICSNERLNKSATNMEIFSCRSQSNQCLSTMKNHPEKVLGISYLHFLLLLI